MEYMWICSQTTKVSRTCATKGVESTSSEEVGAVKGLDINVHYHPDKANALDDALSKMSMGSTAHVKFDKKELIKDLKKLSRLGVWLIGSTSGGVSVHSSSEYSLVVEFKKGQHLDPVLMQLKDSELIKMNGFFVLGGVDILRYQDRLCVQYVDDFRTKIFVEAHGSKYSIHQGSTKMYRDLKQINCWDGMKKDIDEYVAKCPNCQQVKAEHLKPSGLT
ncbi:uncharacterized protein [Solanum lycopersicum]|uniref:uncharacterized protein n=1 Tax=Solanum lycopersicum TaxID=4081 RepID=UPI0037479A6E